MRQDILKGNIEINPTEKACSYCPYGGVCGFDRKLGDRYRKMEKVDLEEVITRLNSADEVE
jgi:ATP-dependent helicase/nuclease subunit B